MSRRNWIVTVCIGLFALAGALAPLPPSIALAWWERVAAAVGAVCCLGWAALVPPTPGPRRTVPSPTPIVLERFYHKQRIESRDLNRLVNAIEDLDRRVRRLEGGDRAVAAGDVLRALAKRDA